MRSIAQGRIGALPLISAAMESSSTPIQRDAGSVAAGAALGAGRSFAFFAVLSVVTLALGGWLTSLGLGEWYDALEKPPFQPAPWVFTPTWTVIFALLAYATWRVASGEGRKTAALGLYWLQLVLNAGWSLFFFTLARPDLALVEIAVLDAVVLAMVVSYGRLDRDRKSVV